MRSSILYSYLFSSVAILGIAHYAALEYYLYWKLPWFDIPMHFLGGIVVGLAFLLIPRFIPRIPQKYITLKWAIVFMLIVGLLWELFEVYIGIPLIEADFEIDMLSDLILDILGAAFGYMLGKRVSAIEEHSEEHDTD